MVEMNRTHRLAFTVWLLLFSSAAAQQPSIHVKLPAKLQLERRPVIRLGDVAEVNVSDERLRAHIENLDLAEWPLAEDSISLTRNQVSIRLQLEMPNSTAIRLEGPSETTIRLKEVLSFDQAVISELRSELADRWGVELAAIRVRLLEPLPEEAFLSRDGKTPVDRVSTVVPTTIRPGNVRANLLTYSGAQLVGTHRILVDAQLFGEVVTPRRSLPRGTTVGADDVDVEWQALRDPRKIVDKDDIIGKTTRTRLRRGQPIEARHLSNISNAGQQAVSARDQVRVVMRNGALTATVNDGIALQSGSVGEQIRVRNPRSQKVLIARIVSPTEVHVE